MYRSSKSGSGVYQKLDWGIFFLILTIPIFGLITLYSAGYSGEYSIKILQWPLLEIKSAAFLRQGAYFLASLPILLILCSLPIEVIKKVGGLLYCISVGLLVLVALFGTVVNGSRRWLTVGSWNIQPAELVKVAVIICMAICLSRLRFRRWGQYLPELVVSI